jgi:hypothetical protein
MIECPTCRISFSPRFRRCPRCGVYEARLEHRMEYLARAAELQIDRGVVAADVEALLVAEGVSPLEAGEVVAAAATTVARAERRYGLIRLFGGGALLVLAIAVAAAGMYISPSRWGLRLIAGGVLVGVAAAYPFYLGIYSVLTGRDRGGSRSACLWDED